MTRIAVLLLCTVLLGCSLLSVSRGEWLDDLVIYPASESGEAQVNDVVFPAEPLPRDNNLVLYEIFTGSFSDSNGDGIGDLRGILSRLDYLNDGDPSSGLSLGVEALWLTPVFLSPSYHKYDVTDYCTIDPAFGTLEDLKELIAGCHARGLRLILDLPLNHTGKNHAWFKNFVNARILHNTTNPWYDFYVCKTAEERLPGHVYAPVPGVADQYYEANFSPDMPELNYDLDAVRQAVLDVAKFYLDLGVDGFRFDAAKYIYLGDNDASAAFWKWYTDEIRAVKPDAYLVAEVWDGAGIIERYTPYMSCFDFGASQAGGLISETAQAGSVPRYTAYVEKAVEKLLAQGGAALYSPFIANHDTDRAAGFLPVSNGRAKVAANLYLLGPGSPVIYYGEEIGLKGSRGSASTDANRRLAMRWGDGDTVADPRGTTYDQSKQTDATVRKMKADSFSLYTYYKRLLMIRAAHPEIARGEYRALVPKDAGNLAGGFVATWNGRSVLVAHNTTPSSLKLDLKELGEDSFTVLSAVAGLGQATLADGVLTLEGQTSAVLRQP